MFLFALGSTVLFGKGQLLVLGILLTVSYGVYFLKEQPAVPLEILLFLAWLAWSLAAYWLKMSELLTEPYFETLLRTAQVAAMAFAVTGIAVRSGSPKVAFSALALGALILLAYSVSTGDFMLTPDRFRTTGLTNNPNYFGFIMLMAVVGLLFFFEKQGSLLRRGVIASLIVLLMFGILASGSRKAFVGFVFLMLAWWWFCFKDEVFRRPQYLLLLILVAGLIVFSIEYMLENTFMGRRFQRDFVEKQEQLEEHKRIGLYEEGFELIKQNPVVGVGLGNFKYRSFYHAMSHSDYIEVAVSTGLVGFVLYFSIYVLLWRRLSFLRKFTRERSVWYMAGVARACVLLLLLLALGRPNFYDIIAWVALGTCIGYAYAQQRRLQCALSS